MLDSGRKRAVTLGSPSLILRLFAWGVLISTFVFSAVWLSAPPNNAGTILNLMFGLIPVVVVCYLAATVSIQVSWLGQMTVRNMLTRSTFPITALAAVEVSDGLLLMLNNGANIRSIAYATSLAGEIARYPRSHAAKQNIEGYVLSHNDSSEEDRSRSISMKQLDTARLLIACTLALLLYVITTVVNLLRVA
jgi:hypothetical protein